MGVRRVASSSWPDGTTVRRRAILFGRPAPRSVPEVPSRGPAGTPMLGEAHPWRLLPMLAEPVLVAYASRHHGTEEMATEIAQAPRARRPKSRRRAAPR